MKKKLLFLMTLIFSLQLQAQEKDMKINLSLYAGIAAGYAPWKSFSQFRKEYNTLNASAIKHKLGNLSDQYGTKLGFECFVTRHLYSSVDWTHVYGRTSAEFTNGSKRYFSLNTNSVLTFIGWKQFTPKGSWIIAGGLGGLFGNLNGYIKFADGTKYFSTEGFSGEFRDVNIGVALKFDYERNINQRFSWKFGLQGQFYTETFEEGMQNIFTTKTASAIALNDKVVKMDLSGVTLTAGIVYNLYTLWED